MGPGVVKNNETNGVQRGLSLSEGKLIGGKR